MQVGIFRFKVDGLTLAEISLKNYSSTAIESLKGISLLTLIGKLFFCTITHSTAFCIVAVYYS